MKGLKLFIAISLLTGWVFAQNRLHSIYTYRGSSDGAILLPSTLDLGKHKVQWSGSGQLWLGNSFVSNKGLYQFFDKSEDIVRPDFDKAIDKLKPSNTFGMGIEAHSAISFQVPIFKKAVNFSLGWAEHSGMNWNFSKNMLSLFWKGNKQWAGDKVRLTPFAVNALWYREYALGSALEVYRKNDLFVRAGTRLKLLRGIGALHMPLADIDLTTAEDGQYLLFEYDYDLRYAMNTKDFSPFKASGKGFAMDFGVTVGFLKKFQVDLALTDLGGINFNENASTLRKTSSFNYEGFDFTKLSGVSSTLYLDSLYKSLGFDAPQPGKFRMGLGSRFIVNAMYELGSADDLKDKGRVYFTYIQGFRELPFSTKRPYVGFGYSCAVFKWLEIGSNIGTGGYNRFKFGLLAGLKISRRVHISVSSENVLGLPIPGMASGIDVGGNLVWNFGRYKH